MSADAQRAQVSRREPKASEDHKTGAERRRAPARAGGETRVAAETIDDDLRMLEFKITQLKRDYDQYFLGARPREPVQLRGEINKAVVELTNTAIKNTASRFKFSSICSRYQAFRRQWDENLRKIEAGTYERHRFKAKLHEKEPAAEAPPANAAPAAPARAAAGDLYEAYVDARRSCGESIKGLTREKLDAILDQQRAALRAKHGEDSEFRFRVQIEGGKTRLKAARVKRTS